LAHKGGSRARDGRHGAPVAHVCVECGGKRSATPLSHPPEHSAFRHSVARPAPASQLRFLHKPADGHCARFRSSLPSVLCSGH
jgi:hypothetical protein